MEIVVNTLQGDLMCSSQSSKVSMFKQVSSRFEDLFPSRGGSFCYKTKVVFLLTKQIIMMVSVDRKWWICHFWQYRHYVNGFFIRRFSDAKSKIKNLTSIAVLIEDTKYSGLADAWIHPIFSLYSLWLYIFENAFLLKLKPSYRSVKLLLKTHPLSRAVLYNM